MWDRLSKAGRLLLLPLFALAFFLTAYFYFGYPGSYDPPDTPSVDIAKLQIPSPTLSAFSESPFLRQGTLVVDGLHGNNFDKKELAVLLSRVAARGYEVDIVGESGRFGGFSSMSESRRLAILQEKLRKADSLAVILPNEPYSKAEADLVERFVLRKGGKLLLIADPTRRNEINSLAGRFGMSFQSDYLYNTSDYDLNFQNVFIRRFEEDEVTRGLSQVVFYTAGSIKAFTPGLAFTDGNTRSSMTEQAEPFYPLVKAGEGRVLALSDLTFMIPPRNAVLDNDRLVSNIADYLTDSQRRFTLADFPHFFKGDVDILLGRSSLFDVATTVKVMLSGFRTASEVRGVEDITKDTVFLGLYDDSAGVAQYLQVAGISLDGDLRTPFTPGIDREDTAIILLHPGPERHVLVVLADSERTLRDAVFLLRVDDFRGGLVGDFVGVYRNP